MFGEIICVAKFEPGVCIPLLFDPDADGVKIVKFTPVIFEVVTISCMFGGDA